MSAHVLHGRCAKERADGGRPYDILLALMRIPTSEEVAKGAYAKWDGNDAFERSLLKHFGFPEDYHPTEEEAYALITAFLED